LGFPEQCATNDELAMRMGERGVDAGDVAIRQAHVDGHAKVYLFSFAH
jgi:hypothetical protein